MATRTNQILKLLIDSERVTDEDLQKAVGRSDSHYHSKSAMFRVRAILSDEGIDLPRKDGAWSIAAADKERAQTLYNERTQQDHTARPPSEVADA